MIWEGCGDDELPVETEKDTQSPVVELTEPINGASYTVPVLLTIRATASDNDRVDRVEFFIDGILHDTDYSFPYESSWNTTKITPLKSYVIMARAYDPSLNIGESAEVSITLRGGI